jgi:F-type H+-transporting ATPase subunit delta
VALRGAAARRYAQAAFDLAKEAGSLDHWLADLKTLNSLFGDPNTVNMLENPKLTRDEQYKIVDDLVSKVQVDPLIGNFIKLLVQRGRLASLPRIVEIFGEMYNREKGIIIADVITAIPLDEPHRKEVAERLARITGKTIELRLHTDPSILGGIVTRIGDELIDASVASRLAQLAERLT